MKLKLFGPVNISADGVDCEVEIDLVQNLTIIGNVHVQGWNKNDSNVKSEFSSNGFVFVSEYPELKETNDSSSI